MHRQKLIKLVDCSELGWVVITEYKMDVCNWLIIWTTNACWKMQRRLYNVKMYAMDKVEENGAQVT